MSVYLSRHTVLMARRRPRPDEVQVAKVALGHSQPYLTPAYVVSRPILLATATMALVVLKEFLPPRHPVSRVLRRGIYWQRRCQRSVVRIMAHSRRQIITVFSPLLSLARPLYIEKRKTSPTSSSQSVADFSAELDGVRDRAIAHLDDRRLVMSAATAQTLVTPAEFDALEPVQRRDLLANAFAHANRAATNGAVSEQNMKDAFIRDTVNRSVDEFKMPTERTAASRPSKKVMKRPKKEKVVKRSFWGGLESLNGRIAAVGFVLCLAREILEPGHPSLYDQVEDVLVPIAQSTPPFLVAVCDKIADLLT